MFRAKEQANNLDKIDINKLPNNQAIAVVGARVDNSLKDADNLTRANQLNQAYNKMLMDPSFVPQDILNSTTKDSLGDVQSVINYNAIQGLLKDRWGGK